MFTKSRSKLLRDFVNITVRLLALLLIGVECVVYMVPLVTDSNQCLSPLAPLTKDEVSMHVLPLFCLEFGRVDHARLSS